MSIATLVAGAPIGPGSSNRAAILAVQARLGVPASGIYDDATAAAVTAFQRAQNLAAKGLTAFGIVGHMTALALDATANATVPVSPAAAPAGVQVIARSDFGAAPVWFNWALHEVGVHEVGNNAGPDIKRYIKLAHVGDVGEPWCAIFANAAFEQSGIRGTRSASSQSFRHDPNFVSLNGPALGAVCVFWRGSRSSGLGHVGFYRGEAADRVFVLGGNEGDAVKIEALPKASSSFGLVGYFWPKAVPLPAIGAVPIRAGEPLTTVKVI
jgi:uncharacterized protein (TIGR02594 family)